VNYFPAYASRWWERWSALLAPGHRPYDYGELRRRGVGYIVLTREPPLENLTPVFTSGAYRVYRLRQD
jgi:hypothetical protein